MCAMPTIQLFCPPLAQQIADRYKDIAARHDLPTPCLYAYSGMICSGCSSLCGFNRFAPWSPSVSTLSRGTHLINNDMVDECLVRHREYFLNLVRESPEDYVFVGDTTKNLSRTKDVLGGGLWGDSKGVIYEGQNLLVICLVHKEYGTAIPLIFTPCLKQEENGGKTANHVALELIDRLNSEGWPKLPVCFDSWFDGAWLYEELIRRKYIFAIEMKSSRKPKKSPGPRAKKHSMKDLFLKKTTEDEEKVFIESLHRVEVLSSTRKSGVKNKKYLSKRMIWIGGSKKDKKQLQLMLTAVYNDLNSSEAFGYYATNDLSSSIDWAWTMSRLRWNIEVTFRDLKQFLSFGNFAAKKANGVNIGLLFPVLILGHVRSHYDFVRPLGQILCQLNLKETLRSLNNMDNGVGAIRISILKNRVNPMHANNKPRSSATEKDNLLNKSKKTLRIKDNASCAA
jgi:hypothetical protein